MREVNRLLKGTTGKRSQKEVSLRSWLAEIDLLIFKFLTHRTYYASTSLYNINYELTLLCDCYSVLPFAGQGNGGTEKFNEQTEVAQMRIVCDAWHGSNSSDKIYQLRDFCIEIRICKVSLKTMSHNTGFPDRENWVAKCKMHQWTCIKSHTTASAPQWSSHACPRRHPEKQCLLRVPLRWKRDQCSDLSPFWWNHAKSSIQVLKQRAQQSSGSKVPPRGLGCGASKGEVHKETCLLHS